MNAIFSTHHDALLDPLSIVQKLRNDLIKDFLDERTMIAYLSKEFRMMDVSRIKVELIKKDLKELLLTPVDATLYKTIIDEINDSGIANLSLGNEKLFYREIEAVLKKYIYA